MNADIEHLGSERGHRTLTITRKGGKIVTIPLAPRTVRAIDLSVGEREEGPIFLNHDGTTRLDRHAADPQATGSEGGDREEDLTTFAAAATNRL